jgi:protein gp37
MTASVDVLGSSAQGRLRSIVERIERLEEDKAAVANDIKEVFAFVFPSMCDPFDNHPDLAEPRRRFFDLIRATPNLTWLLLTKRPGNIVKLFREAHPWPSGGGWNWWPRNAAIGCTVVTQEEADRDIPKLLAAKAALNPAFAFLSMEPLLGPVDLTRTGTPSSRSRWCWTASPRLE